MHINFEISGICNAKCTWCQTGAKNRENKLKDSCKVLSKGSFVDFEYFKESIIHMKKAGIININSTLGLFNWGEPFLHPKFKEIISFLKEHQINTHLSTNASKVVLFDNKDDLSKVSNITFSMCGFSQNSYDKIHGFKHDKIIKNIEIIMKNFRECGFKGVASIAYHIYQFNLHEIGEAYKFANRNKIGCSPYVAYINDFNRSVDYLTGNLDVETLKLMGQELFLYSIEKRLKSAPKNYKCPQFSSITIDHKCNVITCCADSSIYKNITEVKSLKEINEWRLNVDNCRKCNDTKLDFVCHNPIYYDELISNRQALELSYNKLYNDFCYKLK